MIRIEFMVLRERSLQAPSLRAPASGRKFYSGWEGPPRFPPRASGATAASGAVVLASAGRGRHRIWTAAAMTGPLWENRKKPKRRREEVAVALRPAVLETELVLGRGLEPGSTGHVSCARSRGFSRSRDAPVRPDGRGAGDPGEAALRAWGGDTGGSVRWHRSPRGDCFRGGRLEDVVLLAFAILVAHTDLPGEVVPVRWLWRSRGDDTCLWGGGPGGSAR